jgi:hypothetical protein
MVPAKTVAPEGAIKFRFGSKADICTAPAHVRFTPNSDIDCIFRDVCFGPILLQKSVAGFFGQ